MSDRVWAGLELAGRWDEPCLVVCHDCQLVAEAPDLWTGQALAARHDRAVHGVDVEERDSTGIQ